MFVDTPAWGYTTMRYIAVLINHESSGKQSRRSDSLEPLHFHLQILAQNEAM